jgi:hypothetical protein
MPPFRLYIPPDGKNLKTQSIFQKHIAIRRRHRPKIRRVQKLFPAPCRRGESPPEVFFIAMLVFSTMCFMFRSCELPYMIEIIFM